MKDIKEQINQVRNELDKIGINTEILENLNKLINDKLEDLNNLSLGLPQKELLVKIWEITRYSECYISLNYISSQEITKLNNSILLTSDKIKLLEESLLNTINPQEERGQE